MLSTGWCGMNLDIEHAQHSVADRLARVQLLVASLSSWLSIDRF
jgi:hypothetical protein